MEARVGASSYSSQQPPLLPQYIRRLTRDGSVINERRLQGLQIKGPFSRKKSTRIEKLLKIYGFTLLVNMDIGHLSFGTSFFDLTQTLTYKHQEP